MNLNKNKRHQKIKEYKSFNLFIHLFIYLSNLVVVSFLILNIEIRVDIDGKNVDMGVLVPQVFHHSYLRDTIRS